MNCSLHAKSLHLCRVVAMHVSVFSRFCVAFFQAQNWINRVLAAGEYKFQMIWAGSSICMHLLHFLFPDCWSEYLVVLLIGEMLHTNEHTQASMDASSLRCEEKFTWFPQEHRRARGFRSTVIKTNRHRLSRPTWLSLKHARGVRIEVAVRSCYLHAHLHANRNPELSYPIMWHSRAYKSTRI